MNSNQVDYALQEWGNRVFNGGPVKKRIRKGLTGLRLLAPQATGAGSGRMDATQVRRRVHSLVKRRPQVMVRISGGGKSIRRIKAHLDYISRNGQIPLEDQQGDKFTGRDDLAALREEWRFGGFAIDDNATTRQAFNIIPVHARRDQRRRSAARSEGFRIDRVSELSVRDGLACLRNGSRHRPVAQSACPSLCESNRA